MIEELIKKYEEELKNCIEQEGVWEKEFSKTDDENYKFTCREYIAEFRIQKVCCNQFLQDLKQLKEKVSKNYEYACECETCIEKNDLLDLIVGSDTDVKVKSIVTKEQFQKMEYRIEV